MQVIQVPNINSAARSMPRNTVVYEVLRQIHSSQKTWKENTCLSVPTISNYTNSKEL